MASAPCTEFENNLIDELADLTIKAVRDFFSVELDDHTRVEFVSAKQFKEWCINVSGDQVYVPSVSSTKYFDSVKTTILRWDKESSKELGNPADFVWFFNGTDIKVGVCVMHHLATQVEHCKEGTLQADKYTPLLNENGTFKFPKHIEHNGRKLCFCHNV